MKKIICKPFFILLFIGFSCNKTNTIKIEFDNIDGLEEKSPVLINGLKIGTVTNFHVLQSSKILVETEINRDVLITEDALYIISSLDILGSKGIVIENGKSKSSIDKLKIQKGQIQSRLINDSTIVKAITNIITKFSTSTKLDSIESELKRLNKKFEKLEEK